jgi:hypothetical protein
MVKESSSFDNLMAGPAIFLLTMEEKQNTLQDILDRGLIVTSFITDVTHPVFKLYEKTETEEEPVAVIITVGYEHYYE